MVLTLPVLILAYPYRLWEDKVGSTITPHTFSMQKDQFNLWFLQLKERSYQGWKRLLPETTENFGEIR